MDETKRANIVVIGGGTGTFTVLNSLKIHAVNLTAVISMADDGGSSGLLRDQYGVLPPGDVRRALVALSSSSDTMRELFNYRFMGGGLQGHNFGNLFISVLEKVTGNFASAIREVSSILNIEGEVAPVTYDDVRLFAKLTDGRIIRGETNIDIPRGGKRAPIKEIWLEPEARLNPSVRRVLQSADMILIGPGDIYTSLIPNLLVRGMREEVKKSRAVKVYVANLMTKSGETDNFKAHDFVTEIEKYLGKNVLDFVLFNDKKPAGRILKRYAREGAKFVEPPTTKAGRKPKFILANLLESGTYIRHDSKKKLAKALLSLLKE
jgi:uncharacterized cofD-like protein